METHPEMNAESSNATAPSTGMLRSDTRESRLEAGKQSSAPPRSSHDLLQNSMSSPDVIGKIEAIFDQITDALLSDKDELFIELTSRNSRVKACPENDIATITHKPRVSRRICFPGNTPDEAWRFTMFLRILDIILDSLRRDVIISKRDIYYRDPPLFGCQRRVDRYVDDIASSLQTSRHSLNVAAAAKGLLAGALSFTVSGGATINAFDSRDGVLVPNVRDIESVNMKNVKWVLVVEKEATFRSVTSSPFWQVVAKLGILITGKGYPDVATRAFLNFLTTPSPKNSNAAPISYGLADFDPDGLSILLTYKCGSRALAHEGARLHTQNLTWIGLDSKHLFLTAGIDHDLQSLLALSRRDRRKACAMLKTMVAHAEDETKLRMARELQTMLMLNVKAETQLLDADPHNLTQLLTQALLGVDANAEVRSEDYGQDFDPSAHASGLEL